MLSNFPIVAQLQKEGKMPKYLEKKRTFGKAQALQFWSNEIDKIIPSMPSRARTMPRKTPY